VQIETAASRVEVLDGSQDAPRGTDGAFRVVAPGEWRPEHRHHGVADVLLDHAAVPFDRRAGSVEEQAVQIADIFGIGSVGSSGGTDDLYEQDGNELALLGPGRLERGAALRTEPWRSR
jgi:hypothetical protein